MKNADAKYEKVLDNKGLGSGVSNRIIYNPLYDSQFKARNETNIINIAAADIVKETRNISQLRGELLKLVPIH